MPRLAKPLYDFLPVEDFLRLALAIWTVFNNAESLRKNRMMARLKVLIDRIGLDEFRGMVEAELAQIGPIDPTPYMDLQEQQRETPPELKGPAPAESSNGTGEYLKWKATNVIKQKQEGYSLVYVKPVRGRPDHRSIPRLGPNPASLHRWPRCHNSGTELGLALGSRAESPRFMGSAKSTGPGLSPAPRPSPT